MRSQVTRRLILSKLFDTQTASPKCLSDIEEAGEKFSSRQFIWRATQMPSENLAVKKGKMPLLPSFYNYPYILIHFLPL